MEMKDELPAPVGTQVIVFRLDMQTIAGEGIIEEWVRPQDIDEEELVADTGGTGQSTKLDPNEATILNDDGSETRLIDVLFNNRTPRIRLNTGEVTYGTCCYWEPFSIYQQQRYN